MNEEAGSEDLSWNYTTGSVFKFALPTVVVVVFMSLYQAVDGFFLANYVNSDAIAAVNIAYPLIGLFYAISLMFASGGVSVVAAMLGEDKKEAASRVFSMVLGVVFVFGIMLAVVVFCFFDECLYLLGASATLKPYVSAYLTILIISVPFILLQNILLFFLVTVGKPNVGMVIVFIGGGANILLDYILIKHAGMGIDGAAIATAIGYFLTCVGSLVYFYGKKNLSLCFCKFALQISVLVRICINGASEMVTHLAVAVTTLLLNYAAMRFFSEDGVAAVAIILYLDFFMTAMFIGFASGMLPLISYNYGAKNKAMLQRLFWIGLKLVVLIGGVSLLICTFFSQELVAVFVSQEDRVFALTTEGLPLWACAFPFIGLNTLAITLFIGFSDGRTAAFIAFMQTGFFLFLFILLLPEFWGIQGIWLSLPFAEVCGFLVALFYIPALRKNMI